MKHFYLFLSFLLISSITIAQIPANYYDSATGTGFALKTQLKDIIDDTDDGLSIEYLATDNGYGGLYVTYLTSDVDFYYENNGTLLDMYSENPNGTDAYEYTYGVNQDDGSGGTSEGEKYNREHIIPQSVFNSNSPMRNDAHFVVPSDKYVNAQRGNLPFGVVDNASFISTNGSQKGSNLDSGYSAGYSATVFEPIDEFKGDIARMYFYFSTRYEDNIASFDAYAMFDGSNDQVFNQTFFNILYQWHIQDPVSQREIDRNNAVYNSQNNRNPFIDNPSYVATIWNVTPDVTTPTVPTMLIASNPTDSSVTLDWTASTDDVAVTSYNVYIDAALAFNTANNSTSTTATNLTADTLYCFTITAIDASGNESVLSNEVCETTTNTGTGTQDCANETFETIATSSSSYGDVNWTGDNGSGWSATEARSDQTINGKAITIDVRGTTSGTLTSPAVNGGIGNLTMTTQRKYGGGSGNLSVYVNGVLQGAIPYDDTVQTSTLSGINIEGNVVVTITEDTSDGDRVAIDDLSWTCYSTLSTDGFNKTVDFKIYPNPLNGNTLTITSKTAVPYTIYDVLGQRIKKGVTSKETIDVSNLKQGLYLIKLQTDAGYITKKLIKQ